MKNKKEKIESIKNLSIQDIWTKLAVLIVTTILFYPIGLILLIVILINIIYATIKKKPNTELVKFSDILSREIIKVIKYLLFISREKPFRL